MQEFNSSHSRIVKSEREKYVLGRLQNEPTFLVIKSLSSLSPPPRTGMATIMGTHEIYTFSNLLVEQVDIHHACKTIEKLVLQLDQLAFVEFNVSAMKAATRRLFQRV